jgi:hypothetical protein
VKKNISKKLAKRKRKINKRIKKIQWPQQSKAMMAGSNIVYDIDGRHQGTAYGGIGNIHQLAARSGLIVTTGSNPIQNHRLKSSQSFAET